MRESTRRSETADDGRGARRKRWIVSAINGVNASRTPVHAVRGIAAVQRATPEISQRGRTWAEKASWASGPRPSSAPGMRVAKSCADEFGAGGAGLRRSARSVAARRASALFGNTKVGDARDVQHRSASDFGAARRCQPSRCSADSRRLGIRCWDMTTGEDRLLITSSSDMREASIQCGAGDRRARFWMKAASQWWRAAYAARRTRVNSSRELHRVETSTISSGVAGHEVRHGTAAGLQGSSS